jgi:phosphate uptake regulator
MESRKLQEVGNRSYSVSLPKKWIVDNKLGKHDSVFIETTDNNELVLRSTPKTEKSSKQIKIKADDPTLLSEFLVFCYMKNIDTIRFYDDELSYDALKAIRKALNYLEGYDVVAETSSSIDIAFLFKDIDITIPKIIHRMFYLIKLHVDALANSDTQSLLEAEIATDRLHFLSIRIIFACLQDYNLRIENGIHHMEDLFFYKNITKRLENVSDQLLTLGRANAKDVEQLRKMVIFIDKVLIHKEDIKTLKELYLKMHYSSKDATTDRIFHKLCDLCKDLLEARISLDLNEKTNLGL